MMKKIAIVDYDVITPYGLGLDLCWNGLLDGQSAIKPMDRFNAEHLISQSAATISELDPSAEDSLVMQMLNSLFAHRKPIIPDDASLFLATTVGEIDLLEKNILVGKGTPEDSNIRNLLSKVEKLVGSKKDSGVLVSGCMCFIYYCYCKSGHDDFNR